MRQFAWIGLASVILTASSSGCCWRNLYCRDNCGPDCHDGYPSVQKAVAYDEVQKPGIQKAGKFDYGYSPWWGYKKHWATTCQGCGDIYWDEWHSDPPDCCDPCDNHGNWVGPKGGRPWYWSYWWGGIKSLWGYRYPACDCGYGGKGPVHAQKCNDCDQGFWGPPAQKIPVHSQKIPDPVQKGHVQKGHVQKGPVQKGHVQKAHSPAAPLKSEVVPEPTLAKPVTFLRESEGPGRVHSASMKRMTLKR